MKRKHFFLLLPVLLLLIPCLLIPAAAENTSGILSSGHTWAFEAATGTLTVSGDGALPDYPHAAIAELLVPWYPFKSQIKTVIVSGNVTRIGVCNFCDLPKMTRLELPNSLTEIGETTFTRATSLKSVSIPNSVTRIEPSAFRQCSALESITLPDSLSEISIGLFRECSSLKKVTLGSSAVTISAGAFADCTKLTDIVLPKSVTTIQEDAFSGCKHLTSITIPKSTTYIGRNAFSYCTELREITVLGAPEISLSAFGQNNRGIELIRFCGNKPSFHVRALEDVYATCYYPQDNSTWNSSALENYGGTITWIASADPSQEKAPSGEDPRAGICGTGTKWKLSDGVLTVSGTGPMEYVRWDLFKSEIKKVVIEKGVTSIADSAFIQCTNLKEVSIADSVTSIGANAFDSCTRLASIHLPKNLTTIHWFTFRDCTALTQIVIPNGVKTIGESAFWGAGLREITLSNSLEVIESSAFTSCAALTEIRFPASLKRLGDGAFSNCTSLKTIYFAGDVPSVSNFTFNKVTATAYYPQGNKTWEDKGLAFHNGKLTVKPDKAADNATAGSSSGGSSAGGSNSSAGSSSSSAGSSAQSTTPPTETTVSATSPTENLSTAPNSGAPEHMDSTPTENTLPQAALKDESGSATDTILLVAIIVALLGVSGGVGVWHFRRKKNH